MQRELKVSCYILTISHYCQITKPTKYFSEIQRFSLYLLIKLSGSINIKNKAHA